MIFEHVLHDTIKLAMIVSVSSMGSTWARVSVRKWRGGLGFLCRPMGP